MTARVPDGEQPVGGEGRTAEAEAWVRCPEHGPWCGGLDCCCVDMHSPAAPVAADDGEESVDLTPGDVWSDAQIAVVRNMAARIVLADRDLAELRGLLDRLAEDTDDVPCRYDHHGACQEHGGGSEEPGDCADREAHELLKRVGLR